MKKSRAQSPPINADNCVAESVFPPSDSGDFLKLVSLFISESANKIKVNIIYRWGHSASRDRNT